MSEECEQGKGTPTAGSDRRGLRGEAATSPASHQGPLAARTKAFALEIVRLYGQLPRSTVAQVLGRQLLRSGTSVGAQYREATRARSPAEFVSKVESALQELEETRYWLELLSDAGVLTAGALAEATAESGELTAMLVSSARTAKERRRQGAT
ncbi:MAG: four helix bundle protein [Armatimonadetes bacterium]|nr:four helix bundle protein [Armatimonadota bacterium]